MSKSKLQLLRERAAKPKAQTHRPENVRQQHYRILIVCEGEQTEPNYFRSLAKDKKYTAVLSVEIRGIGRGTTSLVKEAMKLKQNLEHTNFLEFDSSWVVFDEDDHKDFNQAIDESERNGFKAAWSNEAFELWYVLHFEYLNTGITRKAYIDKLNDILRKKLKNAKYKYEKNDPAFYRLLQQYGNEELAKKFAKKLRNLYTGTNYSAHKPCTTVDQLVEELKFPERYIH